METVRLRKIQLPARLEKLLDSLVSHSDLIPDGAFRTRNLGGLSRDLRALVAKAAERGQVWGCWERGSHSWLILGEMSLDLSRERGSPVLRIEVYGDEGLRETGLWTSDRGGKWSRCSD